MKSSGARAWAWGSKCDLIALLLSVHLFLISGHGWVVGVLMGGCRPVRDEDGSRVGKNSVSQVALRRGRIVLGGGMYVAKWVLKLGIRSSTVIRVEGVVLKEGCWM